MRARVIHAFPARIFNANTSLRRSTTTLCRVGLGPRIMRSGAYMCAYVRRLAREFRAKLGQPICPIFGPFVIQIELKLPKKCQFLCNLVGRVMSAYLPWNRPKSANFPVNKHFLPKNLKKMSIFVQANLPHMCQFSGRFQYKLYWKPAGFWKKLQFLCSFGSAYICRISAIKSGKMHENLGFWALFPKKCQFFAIFCNFLHTWFHLVWAHISPIFRAFSIVTLL